MQASSTPDTCAIFLEYPCGTPFVSSKPDCRRHDTLVVKKLCIRISFLFAKASYICVNGITELNSWFGGLECIPLQHGNSY